MIYERYDRYEQRMLMLSRIVAFIKRHFVTVVVLPLALIAATVTFLSLIGTFTGAFTCPATVYGEVPTANATAFLSDVSYQYTTEGEAAWSAGLPTRAGEYRLRAVSKNGFGKLRYSDEIRVVIHPAALRFRYDDFSCVYGDEQAGAADRIAAEGLVYRDRIADLTYEVENYKTVRVTSFRVVDGEGTDVTNSYAYTPSSGSVTLLPRNISVSSSSLEKVYDGAPLSGGEVTVSGGSLVEGDSLKVSLTGTLTDAGTVENLFTVRVVDEKGRDVSYLYNVTYFYGALKIKPRPITVESDSAEKVYDGTPLAVNSCRVTGGSLCTGHRIEAISTAGALYVGTYDNTFTCKITDQKGRDVTANYDIKAVLGKLKITPIVLSFRTGSAEKVYDGKPLTNSSWTHTGGKLLSGHSFLTVRATGSQTDAGTSDNTILVRVRNSLGEDITDKIYAVDLDAGKLTVHPKPVTIRSVSDEKLYDGRALINHSWYTPKELVEGHYSSSSFTGSQTEVGSSPNFCTTKIYERETHKDVSHNYAITYEYGTLTVHPNPSHEEEDHDSSISKLPFDPDETVYAEYTTNKSFVIYLREMSFGDYDAKSGVWKLATPYTGSETHNPLYFAGTKLMNPPVTNVRIELKSNCPDLVPYYMYYTHAEDAGITGNDVKQKVPSSEYYAYIYTELDMSLANRRESWVDSAEPAYRKFVYANYLQLPESTKTEMLKIAAANGIDANSKTVIEDVANYISHAATYNLNFKPFPNGVDMAVYFLTTAKEGICQHYATSATAMYRALGIPARYVVGFRSETDPSGKTVQVTGENAHAWVEVYLDGIGWIYVEVTGGDGGGGGGGGGGGELSDKPVITVQSYSAEKYYDGYAFEKYTGEKYWIKSGTLKDGHRLVATVTEKSTAAVVPGSYDNAFSSVKIVDRTGKDVTDEYLINTIVGKRTIYKRPLVIRTGSATKFYDGTPLEAEEYWIVSGSLAHGHRLNVTVSGWQTNVGSSGNRATATIQTEKGGTVSKYYDIKIIFGTLTVTEP